MSTNFRLEAERLKGAEVCFTCQQPMPNMDCPICSRFAALLQKVKANGGKPIQEKRRPEVGNRKANIHRGCSED